MAVCNCIFMSSSSFSASAFERSGGESSGVCEQCVFLCKWTLSVCVLVLTQVPKYSSYWQSEDIFGKCSPFED